jgi:uncharacterized protein YjiS (DUF1127 family)
MTALKNVFAALAARYSAWRERERAYAELSALDDHTLADLGLRRSDIARIVFATGREPVAVASAESFPAISTNNNNNNGLRAA